MKFTALLFASVFLFQSFENVPIGLEELKRQGIEFQSFTEIECIEFVEGRHHLDREILSLEFRLKDGSCAIFSQVDSIVEKEHWNVVGLSASIRILSKQVPFNRMRNELIILEMYLFDKTLVLSSRSIVL